MYLTEKCIPSPADQLSTKKILQEIKPQQETLTPDWTWALEQPWDMPMGVIRDVQKLKTMEAHGSVWRMQSHKPQTEVGLGRHLNAPQVPFCIMCCSFPALPQVCQGGGGLLK